MNTPSKTSPLSPGRENGQDVLVRLRFDRRLLLNFDWGLLLLAVMVVGCGLFNLYSATIHEPRLAPLFSRQLLFYLMGTVAAGSLLCFDYRRLVAHAGWIYGLFLLLLLYALVAGKSIAHTQRWIDLGFFNLQPSEPAKLALVIILATYYSRHDTGSGFTLRELIPPGGLTLLYFLLIAKQPDLGTGLLMVLIFVAMTLFVKLRPSALLTLLAGGATAGVIGWKYILKPYQLQRIKTFLNPDLDPMGRGYQITQSKIAVGSGGLFGKGFLNGTQVHLDFLPERHTDFAFSVWGEEFGFVGSLAFILVYYGLLFWALHTALAARDKFGVLLSFGIVALIYWQATVNLAMVLGMAPVVGMPLPLFSYGGSSLWTTMAGLALLANVRMRRFQTIPRHQ